MSKNVATYYSIFKIIKISFSIMNLLIQHKNKTKTYIRSNSRFLVQSKCFLFPDMFLNSRFWFFDYLWVSSMRKTRSVKYYTEYFRFLNRIHVNFRMCVILHENLRMCVNLHENFRVNLHTFENLRVNLYTFEIFHVNLHTFENFHVNLHTFDNFHVNLYIYTKIYVYLTCKLLCKVHIDNLWYTSDGIPIKRWTQGKTLSIDPKTSQIELGSTFFWSSYKLVRGRNKAFLSISEMKFVESRSEWRFGQKKVHK